MNPSFLALFKQGHYSRREIIETSPEPGTPNDRGCNQCERFSAAMIAFGFRYDPEFKEHFLRTIDKHFVVSDLSTSTIEIEPHKCSDLLIKTGTKLLVVELKIEAELGDHQNPEKKDFWTEKKGYAVQIGNKYPKCNPILFVTLAKKRSWLKSARRCARIECFAKTWDELIRNPIGNESPMECGIYDCLGSLGISCFNFRGMVMKVKRHAFNAVQVFNLLRKTMDSVGKWDPCDLAISEPRESATFFGINLTSKAFHEIALVVAAKLGATEAGWLGYDSGPENSVGPSIWLYCGTSKAAKGLKKIFDNQSYKTEYFENQTYDLRISPKTEPSDEHKWFIQTLKSIEAVSSGATQ